MSSNKVWKIFLISLNKLLRIGYKYQVSKQKIVKHSPCDRLSVGCTPSNVAEFVGRIHFR